MFCAEADWANGAPTDHSHIEHRTPDTGENAEKNANSRGGGGRGAFRALKAAGVRTQSNAQQND